MEKDEDYDKIIHSLHKNFGWSGLDTLEDIRQELVNDIITATKELINK
jgi:hypothetical protein